MSSRRLLGERVMVKVPGCNTRDGVLISGVKKPTKLIQKFPVRFPNGDVRTYRGNQLLLRGSQAPLLEFVRVGDIIFTTQTLGVVRFIGLHEDFVGTIIVLEPIDPKLPTDPNVESFRKLFPSANLSDNRSYNIIRRMEEIVKILPPDTLLQQLSKIKDKYLACVEETRERETAFEEDMGNRTKKIVELENEIKQQEMKEEENAEVPPPEDDSNMTSILFQPGRLGIKAIWSTGEVEGVSQGEQAEMLGVQVGWTIVKIDDEPYSEELVDSKAAGGEEYTLSFKTEIDQGTNIHTMEPDPVSSVQVPLKEMLTSETAREKYERRIHELNEQIEDFQYTVEALQTKNSNMEKEHEDLPKLRDKVGQLRNSRVMFKGQIKEVQKRLKEWKEKAEGNEKKFNQVLQEIQAGGKKSPQQKIQDPAKRGQGNEVTKPGRRPSVKMPKPDSANTVSIASHQPAPPKIGDGSSETFSLSNLNLTKSDTAGSNTEKKQNRKNNGKKRNRKSWFGNK